MLKHLFTSRAQDQPQPTLLGPLLPSIKKGRRSFLKMKRHRGRKGRQLGHQVYLCWSKSQDEIFTLQSPGMQTLQHAVPYKKESPLWSAGERNTSSVSLPDRSVALPNAASALAAVCSRRWLTKVRRSLHISGDQISETGTFLRQAGDAGCLPKESALTFREKVLPASWQHCKRNLRIHFRFSGTGQFDFPVSRYNQKAGKKLACWGSTAKFWICPDHTLRNDSSGGISKKPHVGQFFVSFITNWSLQKDIIKSFLGTENTEVV